MDKKIIAVGIIVILLVASVAVVAVINNDDEEEDVGTPTELDSAGLKVYGNINGDWFLDGDDVKLIQKLIDDGKTAYDYPLADANRDNVLDQKDIDVIDKVIDRKPTVLWHINYHDKDGNGSCDEELVSSKFPVSSVIMNGSSNVAISLFTLGIIDQVKGASYSATSMDKDLFGDTYLDTSKVVKLGDKSSTIPFEDGKAGSSDVIQKENVTAVIGEWNRTYLKNEADFENSNIDVIRISPAATSDDEFIHSTMLLGLMFGCIDRAEAYTTSILEVFHYVDDTVKDLPKPKAVASSSTGSLSSSTSDYTFAIERAGAVFGLPNIDFSGRSSVKLADHPEILMEDFDYICHIRTNVGYNDDLDPVKTWNEYTGKFQDWEHSENGQVIVSGVVPVALRIGYLASFMHDEIPQEKIDGMHQNIIDQFYNGKHYDVKNMNFVLTKDIVDRL